MAFPASRFSGWIELLCITLPLTYARNRWCANLACFLDAAMSKVLSSGSPRAQASSDFWGTLIVSHLRLMEGVQIRLEMA